MLKAEYKCEDTVAQRTSTMPHVLNYLQKSAVTSEFYYNINTFTKLVKFIVLSM